MLESLIGFLFTGISIYMLRDWYNRILNGERLLSINSQRSFFGGVFLLIAGILLLFHI